MAQERLGSASDAAIVQEGRAPASKETLRGRSVQEVKAAESLARPLEHRDEWDAAWLSGSSV